MKRGSTQTVLSAAVLAALTALPVAPVVLAQDGVLEEVVVTSRKRTENLQDVGFAVSALTKSEIEGQFARDITDLANISPNIVIDDTAQGPGGVAAIFIRGIGVADVEKTLTPPSRWSSTTCLSVPMRAACCAVSILKEWKCCAAHRARFLVETRLAVPLTYAFTPHWKLGGKVRVGYENYDTFYADGIFNGIGENLAVKLSQRHATSKRGTTATIMWAAMWPAMTINHSAPIFCGHPLIR